MTLEQEFIEATKRWYTYVNKDHHKDRDCHWYLDRERVYSYGQSANKNSGFAYKLWHSGYIVDDEEFWGDTEDEVFKQGIEFIDNFIKNDENKESDN